MAGPSSGRLMPAAGVLAPKDWILRHSLKSYSTAHGEPKELVLGFAEIAVEVIPGGILLSGGAARGGEDARGRQTWNVVIREISRDAFYASLSASDSQHLVLVRHPFRIPRDLHVWGDIVTLLGLAVSIAGIIAAPFSMGASLALTIVGGALALVGAGLTFYADVQAEDKKYSLEKNGGTFRLQLGRVSVEESQTYCSEVREQLANQHRAQQRLDDLQNEELWRQECAQQLGAHRLDCCLMQLEMRREGGDQRDQRPQEFFKPRISDSNLRKDFQEQLQMSLARLSPTAVRVDVSVSGSRHQGRELHTVTIEVEQTGGSPFNKVNIHLHHSFEQPFRRLQRRSDKWFLCLNNVWGHFEATLVALRGKTAFTQQFRVGPDPDSQLEYSWPDNPIEKHPGSSQDVRQS